MEVKKTLLMPKTNFEMRGNLPCKEPAIREKWEKEKSKIFEWIEAPIKTKKTIKAAQTIKILGSPFLSIEEK